jgi:hypothetical protein
LKLWDQKLLQPGPIEWHHLLAKFHEKIYQAVQKISTDAFYLKPATPLGRFRPTANNQF